VGHTRDSKDPTPAGTDAAQKQNKEDELVRARQERINARKVKKQLKKAAKESKRAKKQA
jgi:hypothetical protein